MSSNRASGGSSSQKSVKRKVNSTHSKTHDNFKARDKPQYRSGNRPSSSTRDRGIDNPRRRRPNNRPRGRPESSSSDRSQRRYGDRSSSRSDGRSNYRSTDRPNRRSDSRSGSRSSSRSGDGPRQEFKAVCSSCNKETTLPFKPSGSKPVYCRDCFQDHKPRDRGSDGPRRRSSDRPQRRYDDRSSSRSRDGPRQEFKAVCSACNKETTLPFKPTGVKPVYCRDCFQDHKPRDTDSDRRRRPTDRSRGRQDYRSSDGSRRRYDDRSSSRSEGRPRQEFKAVCSDCNKETTLPFKPTGVKPVYCRDCFQDHKPRDSGSEQSRRRSTDKPQRPRRRLVESSRNEATFETTKNEKPVERFGDRKGPYRSNKRMHTTICRDCKSEVIIPFKPTTSKPIYCQSCYQKVINKK